jgi:hypothetical protein
MLGGCQDLELAVQSFLVPMRTGAGGEVPAPLRGKESVIFGNLEDICHFHRYHCLQTLPSVPLLWQPLPVFWPLFRYRWLKRDVVYLCRPIAPPIYESHQCGGMGGGGCGVSANEYSFAHHVT